MIRKKHIPVAVAAFLLLILSLFSCRSLISPYSETAYKQATELKAESLVLIKKINEPYSDHQAEVEKLRLDIEKAYEYAKGRKPNYEAIEMWEEIRSTDGKGGGSTVYFMDCWKRQNTNNACTEFGTGDVFIDKAVNIISKQYDQIIELEMGRKETSTK